MGNTAGQNSESRTNSLSSTNYSGNDEQISLIYLATQNLPRGTAQPQRAQALLGKVEVKIEHLESQQAKIARQHREIARQHREIARQHREIARQHIEIEREQTEEEKMLEALWEKNRALDEEDKRLDEEFQKLAENQEVIQKRIEKLDTKLEELGRLADAAERAVQACVLRRQQRKKCGASQVYQPKSSSEQLPALCNIKKLSQSSVDITIKSPSIHPHMQPSKDEIKMKTPEAKGILFFFMAIMKCLSCFFLNISNNSKNKLSSPTSQQPKFFTKVSEVELSKKQDQTLPVEVVGRLKI